MNLEEKIGYRFQNPALLRAAVTHSSYSNENREKKIHNNERLEFLGDSVLGFLCAEYLFAQYRELPEGQLTKLRAAVVCEQSLFEVAKQFSLSEDMLLGRGEEACGGRERPSLLADAVEAVIAALYLDGGMETARGFIERHILSGLDTESPSLLMGDYKTELQELIQRKSGQSLSYVLLGESGPDHDKLFTSEVCLNGRPIGSGTGRTKKEAEQAAAHAALEALKA